MRVHFYLLILFAWSLLVKCQPANSHKNDKLWFGTNSIQKQVGQCDETSLACARVDINYPVAKGKNDAALQAINDSILRALVQYLAYEAPRSKISEKYLHLMADSFLLEWETMHQEEPEMTASAGWEVTINGAAEMNTPKVASVSLSAYTYAGGAHPNSSVAILNFDVETGQILHWADLLSDSTAFFQLAEHHFKKARQLPLNSNLNKEGFFWDGGFQLPQNFEVQAEGIYFWYNPYEVAPYAQGPTDFLISYQEIGKLIRSELIFEVGKYGGS
jgi:hypothetical protein